MITDWTCFIIFLRARIIDFRIFFNKIFIIFQTSFIDKLILQRKPLFSNSRLIPFKVSENFNDLVFIVKTKYFIGFSYLGRDSILNVLYLISCNFILCWKCFTFDSLHLIYLFVIIFPIIFIVITPLLVLLFWYLRYLFLHFLHNLFFPFFRNLIILIFKKRSHKFIKSLKIYIVLSIESFNITLLSTFCH
jgi:hypothetical protein